MSNEKLDEQLKQTLNNFASPPTETVKGDNLAEVINAWFNPKHLHSKTRLNANQIIAVTILKTLADKWHVKTIKLLIENFIRYKLSEGGESSKELVDILKNRTEINNDEGMLNAIKPFLR